MARLGMLGAETGAAPSAGVTVVSSPVRSGAGAYAADASANNAFAVSWPNTPNRWFYVRCWFRITQLPPSGQGLGIAHTLGGGHDVDTIYVLADGRLSRLTSGAPTSAPIGVNEWNCLEFAVFANSGQATQLIVRLNSVEFDQLARSAGFPIDQVYLGAPQGGTGGIVYLDDIAWNDDTGTAQNSWPGVDGRVALLTPDADAAIGNDWTGGVPIAQGDYASEVLADSPAGYWKLDDASGAVAASTAGAAGTITSGTLNAVPIVGDGGAAWENTAASANRITFPTSIAASASFSLEAWWRYSGPGNAATNITVLRDNTATGAGTCAVRLNSTTPSTPAEFRIAGTTVTTSTPSSAFLDGRPHHIVLTRSGTTGKLYLDGVEIGSGTIGTGALTTPLTVGRDGSGTGYHNAKWDHVAVYATALSAGRVLAHCNAGTSTPNVWQAVNNTPPLGVANNAVGWGGKQIRDAVNNVASPASDADLRYPAYSTVVPAGNLVRAAQASAYLSTTGGSLVGELGLVANPAETPTAVNATGTAGTFPSLWSIARSTGVSEPAVALTDRPVVRLGKRSASSSGLLCCLLGIDVEYGPPTIEPGGAASTGTVGGATLLTSAPATGIHLGGVAATSAAGPVALLKELPPRVPAGFDARWASGVHVGAARPLMRVQIRTGRFNRRHANWFGNATDGITIHGVDNTQPWQAFWEPDRDYIDLPNVSHISLEQSLDQNGITTATLTIDNIFYRAEAAGHHSIKRGYMAPLRGYVGPGQDELIDEQGETVVENEWFGLLFREAQITVHQAYGPDAEIQTFTGLIDDVDTTSRPDVITVTARDFGKVLNDERVFGWNKEPAIKDPVVFIDEDQADNVTSVGSDADASSQRSADEGPGNVLDSDGDTQWTSAAHTVQAVTEYVQIRLPQGRYSDFYVSFGDAGGYEMYVSLQPKALSNDAPPTWNGSELPDGIWIDGGSGADVPGDNGGHAYLRLVASTPLGPGHKYQLASDGSDFIVGDDSILRLSFRNLNLIELDATPFGAIVVSLKGRRRTLLADAAEQKWVRVDDASDVVRQILRWAGFKEWVVESAGVPLGKRFVVNRGMTYMDVIQRMKETLGYTFYIADPDWRPAGSPPGPSSPNSIGVPVFRRSLVVENAAPVLTVTDHTLLRAIDVKQSDESLAYIIRVRGRQSNDGQRLGGDASERIMFTYRPPWSGARLGGIIKHVIHTDNLYRRADDVKFGAYYIALQEALASVQASIEIPAHPGPQLDEHVGLHDLGTGVTGRLSVQQRSSTFERTAEKTTWTMTLGGALVDTPDVAAMVLIINTAKRA